MSPLRYLLHGILTRHKPHSYVTSCRLRPKSAPKPAPYSIKSQHCGRHTKRNLSAVLTTLNLLAFACHTVCDLAVPLWRPISTPK